MSDSYHEENVFGEHDGSTYSATLCRDDEVWYFKNLLVDEHNMPISENWKTRDEAMKAVALIASGGRPSGR